MHIGIDIRALASPIRTGVGEYTFELLNALFTGDTTNHYYLFANARPALTRELPMWKQDNIHYLVTHLPNKLLNASTKLFSLPTIDGLITKQIPKLDYFFSPNLNFTALSPITKHILTIHDLSFEFFPQFFSTKQRLWHYAINPRKQCQKATIIITPSQNTKRDLVDFYQLEPEKIVVIPHGLSTLFSQESQQPTIEIVKKYNLPEQFILFLGTIEPRKNILGIIEGFEQALFALSPELKLVIVGSPGWNNQPIFERIKASRARDRICYRGYIEPNDKPALYHMAKVFVYPSFYEGFGFPVIEAMASGTPVITANRSSLPEVAGPAAYYINPHKPHTIAEALSRIINNPEIKNRLSTNGLEQSKKYTWAAAAQKFRALFENSL